MMDLGQLRSFVEVAERGTVAAAASALDFTPPAISQHIAKLEAEVDTALFDRAGRRLRLTAAGHTLLPLARQMLDLDYQGRFAVSVPPARPHYVVAGFASAIAHLLIPRLPMIGGSMTVDIVESEDAEALRDLRVGAVDLVLTQEYQGQPIERDDRLQHTPLVTDQLRLALPGHLPSSTTIDQLADEPWLVNGQGTRCSGATTQILASVGIEPTFSGTVADNDTLLALVAAGHGVTIVPDLLLATPPPGVTVASQDLGISRTIFAVHRAVTADAVAPLLDLLSDDPG